MTPAGGAPSVMDEGGAPLTGGDVVEGGILVTGGDVTLPEGGEVPPVDGPTPLGGREPPLGGVVTGLLTVIVTALDTPAG